MKKIFLWSLLAFVLSSSAYGQIRIDSVFIENDTIIPNPMDSIQTITDTIGVGANFNFRGVSTLDSNVSDVYWRVAIDYDNNGNFSTLYLSGAIPPGSTPDTTLFASGLLEQDYGTINSISIELTTDPTNFGLSGGYTGYYNKLLIIIFDTTGGRVTMGSKEKGSDTTFGVIPTLACVPSGVIKDNLFRFYIYNWLDDKLAPICTATDIIFTSAEVYRIGQSSPTCTLDLTPIGNQGRLQLTTYDATGTPSANSYASGFTLLTDEKAKVEIQIPTACTSSDQIERIEIIAEFDGCNAPEIEQPFCFGCLQDVVYANHSTEPSNAAGNLEEHLPNRTLAEQSIILKDSVFVLTTDSVELVVNNTGFIRILPNPTKDIKVEQGAYFWAHKDNVCPIPVVPANNPPAMEQRSKILKDHISIAPNPFTNSFYVNLELKEDAAINIVLYDVLGHQKRVIKRNELMAKGQQQIQVNIENLAAAMYYCQIQIGNKQFTKTIVKID